MAPLQRKSLRRPDELRPLGRGRLELVELGEAAIGRVTYQPGWRWSEDVRPLVGTPSCDVHHIGFVLSGRLHVVMDDGSMMDIEPEDAFDIPPGHDAWVVGNEPWVAVDSLGRRHFGKRIEDDDARVLGSILFTDIVGSTEVLTRVGDTAWRSMLADCNAAVRGELDRHRGREVASTGDGMIAVFDSPTRAVRCAIALVSVAHDRGLSIRAGVHTGEYQQAGSEIRGLAVHLAARVMATAGADQVRVSAATASLLDRSVFELRSQGEHELKGLPGPVELLEVRARA